MSSALSSTHSSIFHFYHICGLPLLNTCTHRAGLFSFFPFYLSIFNHFSCTSMSLSPLTHNSLHPEHPRPFQNACTLPYFPFCPPDNPHLSFPMLLSNITISPHGFYTTQSQAMFKLPILTLIMHLITVQYLVNTMYFFTPCSYSTWCLSSTVILPILHLLFYPTFKNKK